MGTCPCIVVIRILQIDLYVHIHLQFRPRLHAREILKLAQLALRVRVRVGTSLHLLPTWAPCPLVRKHGIQLGLEHVDDILADDGEKLEAVRRSAGSEVETFHFRVLHIVSIRSALCAFLSNGQYIFPKGIYRVNQEMKIFGVGVPISR